MLLKHKSYPRRFVRSPDLVQSLKLMFPIKYLFSVLERTLRNRVCQLFLILLAVRFQTTEVLSLSSEVSLKRDKIIQMQYTPKRLRYDGFLTTSNRMEWKFSNAVVSRPFDTDNHCKKFSRMTDHHSAMCMSRKHYEDENSFKGHLFGSQTNI